MSLLELSEVAAGYRDARQSRAVPVLFDVSLHVEEGEIVALLGPNGAGKTTTLRTIAGLLRPLSGTVMVDGRSTAGLPPERVSRLGVQFIPEGGGVLRDLTVIDNLWLSGYIATGNRRAMAPKLEKAFDLFPVLGERRTQLASTLSGGERQMLALAQAAMTDARLLLIDEASLGLAPKLVAALFEVVARLRQDGRSILLVEQNANLALDVADRAYVMEKGRVHETGATGVVEQDRLAELYLGDEAVTPR
ncbi:MAG TPA: ABC transporter ATP-binding protein [Acidimicrobiia bacterium]|nr:ABC transporter ATP-binding protein [Acidimicrobiia bacterium]